jgi:hypothetical protein
VCQQCTESTGDLFVLCVFMGSTEVQLWKQKEWSTIKRHKTENSDVRKKTGTSVLKPKCIFDLCNTYINGTDYTDQYHSQHHAQGN